MPENHLMRWQDLVVILLNLAVMVGIGVYCARRTRSADSYFLADRSMPGWVVGFSMMATLISSMTFLAIPGATFSGDWRFMPAHFLYFIPAAVGYFLFLPFFRRGHVRSAYEYLERRFGTWARLYGAMAFLLFHLFRVGIILYAVSLALHQMCGFSVPLIISVLGVLVAAYTIAGGLQAVIYTDFIQGLALIAGGLICTPIIAHLLPGSWEQIFTEAHQDGKFGVGSTAFVFKEKTVWVIILVYQFQFLQLVCTDQSMVQRYLAMKTDKQARRGFVLGTVLTIPVWLYFAFVGTALYVFYKNFPAPELVGVEPEEVFPHFVLTQIPAGVAGFVMAGMLAAAMSTLDSSINASAATVTTDFYRRFRPSAGDEQHYLSVGRWFSLFFAAMMVAVALYIDHARTETLMDFQTTAYSVVSAGLLSLFLLGFLTVRVGSTVAFTATASTVLLVACWLFLATETGAQAFPDLASLLPDKFWIGVLPHLFLLAVGGGLALFIRRRSDKSLENLTIWTRTPQQD
jgi:SSS family solute:Na+ symporter